MTRSHVYRALPLRALFGWRAGSHNDLSALGPQAASVLDYLMLIEGAEAKRDFFGLLSRGADLESALQAMPRPASITSLERRVASMAGGCTE